MQDLQLLTEEDLKGLAPEAVAALAQQMLQRLRCQDSELKFKDAKIEEITFQLAQLKAWKFGAKTEAMSAEQRRLFEETLVEDEASLQAQLDPARGAAAPPAGAGAGSKPAAWRSSGCRHSKQSTPCPSESDWPRYSIHCYGAQIHGPLFADHPTRCHALDQNTQLTLSDLPDRFDVFQLGDVVTDPTDAYDGPRGAVDWKVGIA